MQSRLAAAFTSVIVSACALLPGHGLKPGVSTEREVRASMGSPAMEFADSGGGRVLAYTTGPMGTQTYLARLGPNGTLASFDEVLKEETFRRLHSGTTTSDEVLRLIGPPWRKVAFPNLRQVAWDYRFMDTWGYIAEFSVMIDERGIVAGTVTVRLTDRQGMR